ncbi:MAG: D-glycero-alpha-D-manno-heptose-1,7-bisphosphate 7-phosphatase [Phycisphaerales bacterium]
MHRAVFLDRDDTLIENNRVTAHTAHPGDLLDPALVRALPGARAACARLRTAGYLLIVVTNQAGVAENLCPPETIEAVNDRFREVFGDDFGHARVGDGAGGGNTGPPVRFDAAYYSPFIKTGVVPRFIADHDWRKPRAGMITTAAREFGVDLARSWMVGDAPRDVEAGIAAGISAERCLRIGEGLPFADVGAAAAHILSADGHA